MKRYADKICKGLLFFPALWSWPLPGGCDAIDQQLERNMHVFAHGPSKPGNSGQTLAYERGVGVQAQMVVFDRMGHAYSPQRVALGPLPPPQAAAEPPLTEYPRHPKPPKPSWELDYSFTSGYREDRLNWNIAAPNYYPWFGHPNVLSELKWENIQSAQIAGKAEITSPGGWHFQGKVNYGFITAGKQQDSDYQGDNRTLEYSRSNNSADGGHMLDASIGTGYRFAMRDKEGNVQLGATPLVGYSYNEQYLTGTNLLQTVSVPSIFWCDNSQSTTPCNGPALRPYPGLDERYTVQWHGPWLGFRLTAQPLDWMELFTQYEYHWVNYYGKGTWNLRPEYAQPYSFKHYADGGGMTVSAGLRFKLTPAWAFDLDANYSEMTTNSGTDNTYWSAGYVTSQKFNRAVWESYGANAGIRYRF
jgi:hypothetical protein